MGSIFSKATNSDVYEIISEYLSANGGRKNRKRVSENLSLILRNQTSPGISFHRCDPALPGYFPLFIISPTQSHKSLKLYLLRVISSVGSNLLSMVLTSIAIAAPLPVCNVILRAAQTNVQALD